MPKPLRVDLPYPSVDNITCDLTSARIIAPAYASLHSELGAILQYTYHFINFGYLAEDETKDVLERISIAEMTHFELLGEMLIRLGADPVFTCSPPSRNYYFNTSEISYSKTPQKMLMDDITGELQAIGEYTQILEKLENEQVSAVISRIRLDEELHVKALKEQLIRYVER